MENEVSGLPHCLVRSFILREGIPMQFRFPNAVFTEDTTGVA